MHFKSADFAKDLFDRYDFSGDGFIDVRFWKNGKNPGRAFLEKWKKMMIVYLKQRLFANKMIS